MWYKEISLPTQLTLIRLVGSPCVLPFLFVYLLPINSFFLNTVITLLFLVFGVTDFFDGYLARKYDTQTSLGAILDPIADKFLLYSTLIALVAAHKLYFFWAILWIGREFFIMTLRQIALENKFSLVVSAWGKLKTVLQIACLAVVIANPYHAAGFCATWWNRVELFLLIAATALSLLSAYSYFLSFCQQFSFTNEKSSVD
jgi:CDP-diacylglycerol--glycerol-3-phosphate 3-phosphatidyltransferase